MPTALDFKTIMQQAKNNVGVIKANNILKRKTITDMLADFEMDSGKNKVKAHKTNAENSSARGLLQSGQSAQDIRDTDEAYDTAVARATRGATDSKTALDNEDLAADTAYTTAEGNYNAQQKVEDDLAAAAKKKLDDDAAAAAAAAIPAPGVATEVENPVAAAANNAINNNGGGGGGSSGPSGGEDFLTWHSKLSPEAKAAFNAAYPAPAPAPKPVVKKRVGSGGGAGRTLHM